MAIRYNHDGSRQHTCGLLDREAATQDFQAALHAPPDKEVAEQLEARALLLAGQAGLCCNPRCAPGYRFTWLPSANIFPAVSAPATHLIWRCIVLPAAC